MSVQGLRLDANLRIDGTGTGAFAIGTLTESGGARAITVDRGTPASDFDAGLVSLAAGFTGGLTLTAGNVGLAPSISSSPYGGGTFTFGGGSLRVTGTTPLNPFALSLPNPVTLAANGGLTLVGGSNNGLTLAGVVSGAGGLAVRGAAPLALTNTNTFAGAVTSDLGVSGNTVTAPGAITLSGANGAAVSVPLVFGAAEANLFVGGNSVVSSVTVSGNMSGSVGLTKSRGETLRLTGDNSQLTGRLTINDGQVSFGSPANLPGTGAVAISAGATTVSVGALGNAPPTTGLTYTGGPLTLNRGLDILGGMAVLNVPQAANALTISGPVTGATTRDSGLVIQDPTPPGPFSGDPSGTVTLAGAVTSLATTIVDNGRLNVVPPAGAPSYPGRVVVNSSALAASVLGGSGTFAGPVSVVGGRLSPGDGTPSVAPGNRLLTFAGGLVLQDNLANATPVQSRYNWQLAGLSAAAGDAGAAYGQIRVVGGPVQLSGGSQVQLDFSLLAATDQPNAPGNGGGFWSAPHQWLILDDQGTGGSTGSFAGLSQVSYGAGSFSLLPDPSGDVILVFVPVPEPATVLLVAAGGWAVARAVRRRLRPATD